MRAYYEEQAILWLSRAFDHRQQHTPEECLDKAIAFLRLAAVIDDPAPWPPRPSPDDCD